MFSIKQTKPSRASQHFHLKPTYWNISAKNSKCISLWCVVKVASNTDLGKEKFVPIVKGSSLDKYKNTMRERPGRSFSVQTLTQPASDNWASKRTTDLSLKALALELMAEIKLKAAFGDVPVWEKVVNNHSLKNSPEIDWSISCIKLHFVRRILH